MEDGEGKVMDSSETECMYQLPPLATSCTYSRTLPLLYYIQVPSVQIIKSRPRVISQNIRAQTRVQFFKA